MIWSNAEVPSRHIMSISGQVNEQSIASLTQDHQLNNLRTAKTSSSMH
jgi:hypothetical protein